MSQYTKWLVILLYIGLLFIICNIMWYNPNNTFTMCVADDMSPGGQRCKEVHRAHAADGGEEAVRRLLYIEELLFVSVAFLREKYLHKAETPKERTLRFLSTICSPSHDVEKRFIIPHLKILFSREGMAQLDMAFQIIPTNLNIFIEIQQNVRDILSRWDPEKISEGSPYNVTNDTAFTLNQGEAMVYCLRKDKNFINKDLLSFVALHEISHVFTESYEHPPRFWENFVWLLREVEEAGIYKSKQYELYPETYCGLLLDHNPRYDPHIPDIRRLPVELWGVEFDGSKI